MLLDRASLLCRSANEKALYLLRCDIRVTVAKTGQSDFVLYDVFKLHSSQQTSSMFLELS